MEFKYHKYTGRWMQETSDTERYFIEISQHLSASRYIEIDAYVEKETDLNTCTSVEQMGNYEAVIQQCDLCKFGELVPIAIDHEKQILTLKIQL